MLNNPLVQAIVLGIVQGLTEFLPVSSSGHLVVVPYLFSWQSPGLVFDVALHAGTLVAVLAYFAGDLWYLATRSLGIGLQAEGEDVRARKTIGLLALGSVPAALAGFYLEDFFETAFQRPLWVAGGFVVTAGLLFSAERIRLGRARSHARFQARSGGGNTEDGAGNEASATVARGAHVGRDETTIGVLDTLAIGVFQALALLPGISRAGSTIAGGMYVGVSREGSARWSFLLSIPAVAGATMVNLPHLIEAGGTAQFTTTQVAIGGLAAAASGYWAIRYLLALVARDDLIGFARYLVFLAILVAVGYVWLGPAT